MLSDTINSVGKTPVDDEPQSPPNHQLQKRNSGQKQNFLLLRASVIACIMIVAAIMGFVSYLVVKMSEEEHFDNAYTDLTKQLLPATTFGKKKINK